MICTTSFPCEISTRCIIQTHSAFPIFTPVKCAFQNLYHAFNESTLVKWWQRYEPQILLSKTATFFISGKKVILEVLAKTGQWHYQCGSFNGILKFYEKPFVVKTLNIFKILTIFYAPYSIFKIYNFATAFLLGDSNQKLESGLEILNEVSSLIDSIIAFGTGLHGIGKLPNELMILTTPLAIISTAFSVSSIFLNMKAIWNLKQYSKKIEMLKQDRQGTEKLRIWLNALPKEELKKILKCNGEQLKTAAGSIDYPEVEKRIKTRIQCESLSITSSTVSLIAIGVLFIAGANPLGYFLVTASAGIYTMKYVIEKVSNKKFDLLLTERPFVLKPSS